MLYFSDVAIVDRENVIYTTENKLRFSKEFISSIREDLLNSKIFSVVNKNIKIVNKGNKLFIEIHGRTEDIEEVYFNIMRPVLTKIPKHIKIYDVDFSIDRIVQFSTETINETLKVARFENPIITDYYISDASIDENIIDILKRKNIEYVIYTRNKIHSFYFKGYWFGVYFDDLYKNIYNAILKKDFLKKVLNYATCKRL